MAGLQGVGPNYTQPGMSTFSPNADLVGRSVQNPGPSGQMPTLTTNNQAAFRHEMDARNHDMVGVLSREMGLIFSPLITNIVRTNQDNAETYQKISSQIGRMT